MLKRKWSAFFLSLVLAVVVATSGAFLNLRPASAEPFADSAFQKLWNVTDSLVANGAVKRTWFWGPTPGFISRERYDQAPDRSRLVQYFEKGRMEINNPFGDRNNPYFVSGGLLVLDMISGNQQVGDSAYLPRTPSTQIVAGDPGDPTAPTYTSFRSVTSLFLNDKRSPAVLNGYVGSQINVAGTVSPYPPRNIDAQTQVIAYNDIFGHNIPRAFWDFMNSRGPIVQNGAVTTAPVINWVFVLGYPLSEPYWANVKIAGQSTSVMIQVFQRRTLVYAPTLPAGFRVQMGNVGTHYYNWLYTSGFPNPTGLQGLGGNPGLTPQILPPVGGTVVGQVGVVIPASRDASLQPILGPAGTKFTVDAVNFRADEAIFAWLTSPDNRIIPLPGYANPGEPTGIKPDANGKLLGQVIDSSGFQPGLWAVTYRGAGSEHESVAYFYVGTPPVPPTRAPVPPTATPGPPPPPTATPVPVAVTINPGSGNASTTFVATISGFQPGEQLQLTANDPDGRTYLFARQGGYLADAAGSIRLSFKPSDTFTYLTPGTWRISASGSSSQRNASGSFQLQ